MGLRKGGKVIGGKILGEKNKSETSLLTGMGKKSKPPA